MMIPASCPVSRQKSVTYVLLLAIVPFVKFQRAASSVVDSSKIIERQRKEPSSRTESMI